MKNRILALFLAGAAGLLASMAAPWYGSGREADPVQDDAAAELAALRRGVDELVALLGRVERRLEEAPSPLTAPETRPQDELAEALRELCARLDRGTLAAPAGREPVTARAPWARPTETVWPALDQLADLWAYDPNAARRDVFFLETDECFARFGPPHSVRASDGGDVRWTYGASDPTQSVRPYKVLVTLHDGRVTDLRVFPR